MLDTTKSFFIRALIIVMAIGGTTVAFTPRYIFRGHSDFDCCPGSDADYDWLAIFIVVPFVVVVALAMGVLKSWLDDRKRRHRRVVFEGTWHNAP